MMNSDQDLKKRVKLEADETLFKDLEFTSEMKKDIQKRIANEQKTVTIGYWKKSTYGVLAVAVFATLLWVSSEMLDTSNENEMPNTFIGETDDGVTNPIDGPRIERVEIQSTEEVKALLGGAVLLPTYVPENFSLNQIHSLRDEQTDFKKVVFTYVSGEDSYLIIMENFEIQQELFNFERVDINGMTGYLYSQDQNNEIHLFKDKIHYMINGLISREDAIKIAKGLEE